MRKKYYHWAPIPLMPESIIEPGNWGRIKKASPLVDGSNKLLASLWDTYRETVLELYREQYFPNKPSRMKSIFLFEYADIARRYGYNDFKETSILYKVELIEPELPIHIADCKAITDMSKWYQKPDFIKCSKEFARYYWENDHSGSKNSEILSLSPIRIVEKLKC